MQGFFIFGIRTKRVSCDAYGVGRRAASLLCDFLYLDLFDTAQPR